MHIKPRKATAMTHPLKRFFIAASIIKVFCLCSVHLAKEDEECIAAYASELCTTIEAHLKNTESPLETTKSRPFFEVEKNALQSIHNQESIFCMDLEETCLKINTVSVVKTGKKEPSRLKASAGAKYTLPQGIEVEGIHSVDSWIIEKIGSFAETMNAEGKEMPLRGVFAHSFPIRSSTNQTDMVKYSRSTAWLPWIDWLDKNQPTPRPDAILDRLNKQIQDRLGIDLTLEVSIGKAAATLLSAMYAHPQEATLGVVLNQALGASYFESKEMCQARTGSCTYKQANPGGSSMHRTTSAFYLFNTEHSHLNTQVIERFYYHKEAESPAELPYILKEYPIEKVVGSSAYFEKWVKDSFRFCVSHTLSQRLQVPALLQSLHSETIPVSGKDMECPSKLNQVFSNLSITQEQTDLCTSTFLKTYQACRHVREYTLAGLISAYITQKHSSNPKLEKYVVYLNCPEEEQELVESVKEKVFELLMKKEAPFISAREDIVIEIKKDAPCIGASIALLIRTF
ncbi:hypothetical protein NECID01_0266 [Nematocida sp. AWRm77]|nr:hypothetical protein NECID01_0266 [Nematocida sp. AWRm77]